MASVTGKVKVALRAGLRNKQLADNFMSAISTVETQFNAAMAKLSADTSGALDVDYVSTTAIASPFLADAVFLPSPYKRTHRQAIRTAVAHKVLGDFLVDQVAGLHASFNALLTKLDADAGTLAFGVKEISSITAVTHANLAQGDYFSISAGAGSGGGQRYQVWFSDGVFTAPALVPGSVLVPVTVAALMTDAQVAAAIRTALNGIAGTPFSAAAPVGATLLVTNTAYGNVLNISENVADAGFLVSVDTSGANTTYVSSLSKTPNGADVRIAHGGQNLATFRQALRSALAGKKIADLIMSHIDGLISAYNAALVQIETGNINGQMAAFQVSVLDPEAYL